MKICLICILTRQNYQKQAQNMIANYARNYLMLIKTWMMHSYCQKSAGGTTDNS